MSIEDVTDTLWDEGWETIGAFIGVGEAIVRDPAVKTPIDFGDDFVQTMSLFRVMSHGDKLAVLRKLKERYNDRKALARSEE